MESDEDPHHYLPSSHQHDDSDIFGKLSTGASTPPMPVDRQLSTPTPNRSSFVLSARQHSRLPRSNQQSVSTATPRTPQRRKSCSPPSGAGALADHRVSPSLTLGSNCFIAYLPKASPVVKARLVEQQDFVTRQAMDEKDIVINKLQEQVRKHIY